MGTEPVKVQLTGEKATMLVTLYGRAVETTLPDPILVDEMALRAVRQLTADFGYDFRKLKLRHDDPHSIAIRAKMFDELTVRLLAENPGATVLHLGCGLDSRVFRVGVPDSTLWYDVDYPEVIELRSKVYPDPSCDYHPVSSSVTDLEWLDQVPADRPVVVVAEGLVPYLDETAGKALFARLAEKFPSGDIVFDSWTRLAVRFRKLQPAVRQAGASMGWGIDDPHELELAIPGFTFVAAPTIFGRPEMAKLSAPMRATAAVPMVKKLARVLHYRFTRPAMPGPPEKVTLTGEKSTLLLTLYGRAMDAVSDHPLLGDRTAVEVLHRLDTDHASIRIAAGDEVTLLLRARELDRRTAEFLRIHPEGTVLHLACGLDSRALRVKRPAGSRWIDVDYPEVVELRRRVYPDPGGNYQLIGSSVTDLEFLDKVPADHPVLVVAEGLTEYLTETQVVDLFTAIARRFPIGQLDFDATARWVVRLAKYDPTLRAVGAAFHWGIDNPAELETLVPALQFVSEWFFTDDPDLTARPALKPFFFLMRHSRTLGRSMRILEYRF
jgi:O-methyltransferase involved in polyketide biosynthesis